MLSEPLLSHITGGRSGRGRRVDSTSIRRHFEGMDYQDKEASTIGALSQDARELWRATVASGASVALNPARLLHTFFRPPNVFSR